MYLGDVIPNYVLKNYFSISRNFPTYETWLVVDSSSIHELLLSRGAKSWLVSRSLALTKSSKSSYRNGFWVNTTHRFFAMQEFHRANPETSLLQIEADVILSKEFPMHTFHFLEESLAFPMSSPEIGLASTLWCKTSKATDMLADFTIECQLRNPMITDTEILGLLAKNKSSDILILRSGPDDSSVYPELDGGVSLALRGSIHQINNNGIFDASTIGIHLCGSDPRNSFGFSRVFDPLDHHFMRVSRLNFRVERGSIFASILGEDRVIYSLHNHSKNASYFNGNFAEILNKYLPSREFGAFFRFSPLGFLLCARDYFQLLAKKISRVIRGGE